MTKKIEENLKKKKRKLECPWVETQKTIPVTVVVTLTIAIPKTETWLARRIGQILLPTKQEYYLPLLLLMLKPKPGWHEG